MTADLVEQRVPARSPRRHVTNVDEQPARSRRHRAHRARTSTSTRSQYVEVLRWVPGEVRSCRRRRRPRRPRRPTTTPGETTTTTASTTTTHDRSGGLMRTGRVAVLLVVDRDPAGRGVPAPPPRRRVPDLGLLVAVAVAFDHGPGGGRARRLLRRARLRPLPRDAARLSALAYALTAYTVGVLQGGVLRTPRWFTPVIGAVERARRRIAVRRRRAAGRRRRGARQPGVRHDRASPRSTTRCSPRSCSSWSAPGCGIRATASRDGRRR